MLDRAKISRYKLKKLVQLFSLDIQADKTAFLADVNRNTVNQWYMLFRKTIYVHRTTEYRGLTGDVEVDESNHTLVHVVCEVAPQSVAEEHTNSRCLAFLNETGLCILRSFQTVKSPHCCHLS